MKVSEQIAIMQAYEDGKTIECKGYDKTEWSQRNNNEKGGEK